MRELVSHILGSGSIGLFLAARSVPGSASLLLRSHHRHRLTRQGTVPIQVTTTNTNTAASNTPHTVPAQIIADLANTRMKIRQLVLTTKAFDALAALQSVQDPRAPLLEQQRRRQQQGERQRRRNNQHSHLV